MVGQGAEPASDAGVCCLQMLLWAFLSLLPLVDGARMAAGRGGGPAVEVGLLGAQEELEPAVTLPEEAVEDEEREDGGHPYSTWHALYGTEPRRDSVASERFTLQQAGIYAFLGLYVSRAALGAFNYELISPAPPK